MFARPYSSSTIGFLISILVSAAIALVPPLLFRNIVDTAIPAGDKRRIVILTIVLVVVAMSDAILSIVQRWYSSRIGEGLIYDLRVALFDKVQHMPIAFFTRTQTGALISRLNNDVVGVLRRGKFDALWLHGYYGVSHWLAIATARSLHLPILLRTETTKSDKQGASRQLCR